MTTECNQTVTVSDGELTVCNGTEKVLDCGTSNTIHILDGTNYGHLNESVCMDNNVATTTGSNNDVDTTTVTTASDTTATTTKVVRRKRQANDASGTTVTSVTSTATTAASADADQSSYIQCKGNNSKESVEAL